MILLNPTGFSVCPKNKEGARAAAISKSNIIESLRFTFTGNFRLKLRISHNRKKGDEYSPELLLWLKLA